MEHENYFMRYYISQGLGRLGQKSSKVLPMVIQWIKKYQDSEYTGAGIDALWNLVVGEQS